MGLTKKVPLLPYHQGLSPHPFLLLASFNHKYTYNNKCIDIVSIGGTAAKNSRSSKEEYCDKSMSIRFQSQTLVLRPSRKKDQPVKVFIIVLSVAFNR